MASLSLQDLDSSPQISESLCRKAVEQNNQLSKVERLLFLSRLDLYGKALADPQSLDDQEVDRLFCRPPPKVQLANIKLIFGLDSITEVIHNYWLPNRIDQLNWDQLVLITRQWWTDITEDVYREDEPDEDENFDPVPRSAGELLNVLRPDEVAFERAVTLRFCSTDCPSAKDGGTITENQRLEKSDEEWSRLRDEWIKQQELETAQQLQERQSKLEEKLKKTTEEDVKAFKELQERMAVEVAADEVKREENLEDNKLKEDSDTSSWASGEFLPADIYGPR